MLGKTVGPLSYHIQARRRRHGGSGHQQRLREHHLVAPVGPLPKDRLKEAVPLPPPPTQVRRLRGEAGAAINLVQNRALSDPETSDATSTVCEPSLAVRGQEILVTGNWFAIVRATSVFFGVTHE